MPKTQATLVLPAGTNFEEFKSNPIFETRARFVAASIASFQFDPTALEDLSEDEVYKHTQKVAIFAIGVADTCLQIMLDNPYQHLDPTQQ